MLIEFVQIIFIIVIFWLLLPRLSRICKRIFRIKKGRGKRRRKSRIQKKRNTFLSAKTKAKAERKYKKLLAEFKRKHKREPKKQEKYKIVITASHHTFPVKGRNVRRWTKGKRGHWNRQKVRKYLLEKYKIVKNYKMQ